MQDRIQFIGHQVDGFSGKKPYEGGIEGPFSCPAAAIAAIFHGVALGPLQAGRLQQKYSDRYLTEAGSAGDM